MFEEEQKISSNSFSEITSLMIKISIIIILIFIFISFCSTLFCYIYFIIKEKRNPKAIHIAMSIGDEHKNYKNLLIDTELPQTFKPLFGYIKSLFVYNNFEMTDKLLLNKVHYIPFWRKNLSLQSKNSLTLPDIKEYKFQKSLIFFEDMLHFFSFAVSKQIDTQLVNLPRDQELTNTSIPISSSIENKTRIEKLKKVDGEWIDYKKYEQNDDVRRIVWKIFAKNKELVVRKVETLNPYASLVNLLCSFYFPENLFLVNDDYKNEMMNFYKNCIWSFSEEIKKLELDLNIIFDQQIQVPPTTLNINAYKISLCEWQNENRIITLNNKKENNLIIINSLIPSKELNLILENIPLNTKLVYVKMSALFEQKKWQNWLKNIFYLSNEDRLSILRSKWYFYPLRKKIMLNEDENEQLLNNAKQEIVMI
ncbi:MAG: DUF58 domain-containing protein [Chitinophagaceae bacterium]|nr:DUF58 domain-containing protein [Chitinophagaceae bacterium]